MENQDLKKLLQQLKDELSGELSTTYAKSKKPNLMGRRLDIDLHRVIESVLGTVPVYETSQLVSTMHEVSEQSARRYTKILSAES